MIVGSTFSHNKIKYFSLSSKRFIHFFVPRVERIRGEDWWKIIVRKVKRERYYALALAKNIGERQFFREITVSLVLRTKLYIFNRRRDKSYSPLPPIFHFPQNLTKRVTKQAGEIPLSTPSSPFFFFKFI